MKCSLKILHLENTTEKIDNRLAELNSVLFVSLESFLFYQNWKSCKKKTQFSCNWPIKNQKPTLVPVNKGTVYHIPFIKDLLVGKRFWFALKTPFYTFNLDKKPSIYWTFLNLKSVYRAINWNDTPYPFLIKYCDWKHD